MTPFDEFRKEAFRKIVGKGKLLVQAVSPFPTMFSTLSKTNYHLCYICRLQMLSIWPDPKFCPLGKSMDLNHSVSVTSISSSVFDLVT